MNTTSSDTRRLADDTLDQLHGRVDRTRAQMSDLTRRSADRMREVRDDVRHQMDVAGERTVGYVRDEPVKSLLMAAGVGALLALAVAMVARNRY